MSRLALILWLVAFPAASQDFMTQAEIDAYEASMPCTVDPERFGIREPKEEEILEHGSGIMVFEYYNSPAGCSDTIEAQGIWYEGTRWGVLKVQVGGREDSDERVWFTPEEVPYDTLDVELPLVIPDHWEPHLIILYPLLY